ncbi:MAG: type II toxin-antitoxin system YoeB family toxin [Methylococcales bacterium]
MIYEELRTRDKRLHRDLCSLLKEMLRGDPASGSGKPEALRHNLAGFWSRRLSQKDPIIYTFDEKRIYIFAIGGHYDHF